MRAVDKARTLRRWHRALRLEAKRVARTKRTEENWKFRTRGHLNAEQWIETRSGVGCATAEMADAFGA